MESNNGNHHATSGAERHRAIDAILTGSDIGEAATCAGVAPETLRVWLEDDAEFGAAMNRAKRERSERLRAEVQALASEAVRVVREIITTPSVPRAIRLRAALAILRATSAMKAETVGPDIGLSHRGEAEPREADRGARA